jgi:hypothetical protein
VNVEGCLHCDGFATDEEEPCICSRNCGSQLCRVPVTKLPVTEVRRFRYRPGDRFIVRVDFEVDQQTAREIVREFRSGLQLPDDVPVVVVPRGFDLEIVAPSRALGPVLGPDFGGDAA